MSTGWVLLIISLGLACLAPLIWYLQRRFEARAVEAEAIVVGHQHEMQSEPITGREAGGNEGYVHVHEGFRPLFRFRDADGREREALSTVAKLPAPYALGARIAILYDPARPEMVQPKDALGAGTLAAILAGLALAGMAVGGVLVLLGF